MIIPLKESTPKLHPAVRMAQTAVAVGNVTVDAGASLWYGTVVRADIGAIHIGENANLQDNVVVHTDVDCSVEVGKSVTVGHGAILHGCTIGDGALIGMGAVLLNGCTIGEEAMVAAGALVTGGTVIPPRMLALGSPARVVRPLREDELARQRAGAAEYLRLSQQLPTVYEEGGQ